MIFVKEYKTRRATFCNNIFTFIHIHQISIGVKNEPYFFHLSTELTWKVSKRVFENFHFDEKKSIEFQLTHFEIPQWSSH